MWNESPIPSMTDLEVGPFLARVIREACPGTPLDIQVTPWADTGGFAVEWRGWAIAFARPENGAWTCGIWSCGIWSNRYPLTARNLLLVAREAIAPTLVNIDEADLLPFQRFARGLSYAGRKYHNQ